MYINSSWREYLQEAKDGMGDGVGWLGGRWGITLYFLYIVNFFVQAASGGVGDCRKKIHLQSYLGKLWSETGYFGLLGNIYFLNYPIISYRRIKVYRV